MYTFCKLSREINKLDYFQKTKDWNNNSNNKERKKYIKELMG